MLYLPSRGGLEAEHSSPHAACNWGQEDSTADSKTSNPLFSLLLWREQTHPQKSPPRKKFLATEKQVKVNGATAISGKIIHFVTQLNLKKFPTHFANRLHQELLEEPLRKPVGETCLEFLKI